MDNPVVSVIMPVFNRETTIENAIRSVLASTFTELEVIVVDDGSVDGTKEVVCGSDDNRVRLVYYGENRGQSFARNYGVSKAKGEYIAFCDSDDEWRPEKLAKQMDRLKSENGRVVYCPYSKLWEDGRTSVCRPEEGRKREGNLFSDLLKSNYIGGPTILMEKTLFTEVGGYDEEFRCLEDYEFILKVAAYSEFLYVDEPLYHAYDSDRSVAKNVKYYFEAMLMLISMYKEEYIRYGYLEDVVKMLLDQARACECADQVAEVLGRIL